MNVHLVFYSSSEIKLKIFIVHVKEIHANLNPRSLFYLIALINIGKKIM